MKKMLNRFLAGALAMGAVGAVDLVQPVEAHAASGRNLDFRYYGSNSRVWNVSCSGGGAVQSWIKYYANDNTTHISYKAGSWTSSGEQRVYRPAGSFAYTGGFNGR